ncbi:MAG: amidohydrolase family protein [Chloroflexota bacterium]|nr:amidohydrolase family protein [Chloroflexota bacterium]
MATPLSVIDTDIHSSYDRQRILDFLSEPWRTRYASGNEGPGHLGYWNPNGVMRADAVTPDGERIEGDPRHLARYFLDEYGIEYGILNPERSVHAGLSPDPDFAAAIVSAINDILAADWLPADPRYRASIIVAPNDPDLAAREIHRMAANPGFVQVLMPSGARMPYGQRYFNRIYAAAVEHDLPVALHPGSEGVGISGAPTAAGYPTNYLEWHTDLVTSYMAHMVSLVTEGTFVKFPTLKFVLIEGGAAWLPPLMWRFDKNWKALRQTTPWLERPPSEYIAEHIRLTTQPIEEPEHPEHLRAILEMFPVERMLMFSSDYPHWDGDTPDFAARALPAKVRSRVLSETARELYHLPARDADRAAAALVTAAAGARHD